MVEHRFGGDWTQDKLRCLSEYLNAYRRIFTANPKARHFLTWYVDAFAGTGSRTLGNASDVAQKLFEDVYRDIDAEAYQRGSARIALDLDSPFDEYLFIEKSSNRAIELKATIENDYSSLAPRCHFSQGDANAELADWLSRREWKRERAVVFLDPYGMQVDWATVAALGATNAVDLWYLFPLGVGVARLLRHDGKIDETWQKRLDLLFGTVEWRANFYQKESQKGLFGSQESMERDASVEKIQAFIEKRLATCFAGVAEGRVLRNSKSSPLYLLCFASANPAGAPIALKIAQHILRS